MSIRRTLTEAEARPIFEPYITGMVDDLHSSFDWVQEILDEKDDRRSTFDLSTQAAMVFDRFVLIAGRRFGANRDALLHKSGRMLRVLLGGKRAALRFKKLRKDRYGRLISSNVKTKAQTSIYYQMGFEGMDDAKPTEFTFGYTSNLANTEVTGLYITCPASYNSNKYVITVEGGEEENTRLFAGSPSGDGTPEQTTIVITPKSKKAKRG